jgi:uncharacterized coiled-coil protein SlyX
LQQVVANYRNKGKKMDNNIEKVEIKISYLENQVKDLNDVVVNQMKDIEALSIQLLKLEQKVSDLIEEAGDGDRPSRKPPHY